MIVWRRTSPDPPRDGARSRFSGPRRGENLARKLIVDLSEFESKFEPVGCWMDRRKLALFETGFDITGRVGVAGLRFISPKSAVARGKFEQYWL